MYSDDAVIRALQTFKRHVLGSIWYQLVTFSVSAFSGLIVALAAPVTTSSQVQAAYGALAAVGTYLGLFTFILGGIWLRTPYRQRDEARSERYALEEKMGPVLEFVIEREEAGHRPGEREWSLVIRNTGISPAMDCSPKVEEIAFEAPHPRMTLTMWPTGRPLHWAGQENDSFDIPGRQSVNLNVAYCGRVPGRDGQHVTLAYRGDESFRFANSIPDAWGAILVLINLVSTGQCAQYLVCRLDIPVMRNPLLASTIGAQPFKCIHCGPDRPELSEFQLPKPA